MHLLNDVIFRQSPPETRDVFNQDIIRAQAYFRSASRSLYQRYFVLFLLRS